MRDFPITLQRLQYPDGQDILEGDHVERDDGEDYLVQDVDQALGEVTLLGHYGELRYAAPEFLTLIDRE